MWKLYLDTHIKEKNEKNFDLEAPRENDSN